MWRDLLHLCWFSVSSIFLLRFGQIAPHSPPLILPIGDNKALNLYSEILWARGDVTDLVWASEDNFSRLWIFTFHSHFRDFLAEISSRDNKLLAWTEKTFVDFELSNWIDFTGSEFWEHNLQKVFFKKNLEKQNLSGFGFQKKLQGWMKLRLGGSKSNARKDENVFQQRSLIREIKF